MAFKGFNVYDFLGVNYQVLHFAVVLPAFTTERTTFQRLR